MGLDAVELLMRVEEDFEISIEDEEAERITTPGQLCALIERKLGVVEAEKSSFCPTSRAFYRVRRELINQGIERAHIKPRAQLNAVLPMARRRQLWHELQNALATPLPPLERPITLLWLGASWLCLLLLGLPLLPLAPQLWFQFLVFGALALTALHVVTSPLRLFPSQNVRTVGDLARRVAAKTTDVALSRDVWPQLQFLIADEWKIPLDQVTRDADFVRDLGMG